LRATDPVIRSILKQARPDTPLVKENEKMLKMHHYDDGAGGFLSFGMLAEYVDSEPFKKFKKVTRTAGFARYLDIAAQANALLCVAIRCRNISLAALIQACRSQGDIK
jgi:hypothetical protein